jgi:hypothetical protein
MGKQLTVEKEDVVSHIGVIWCVLNGTSLLHALGDGEGSWWDGLGKGHSSGLRLGKKVQIEVLRPLRTCAAGDACWQVISRIPVS